MLIKATPEQLDQLQSAFNREHTAVSDLLSRLQGVIEQTHGEWEGQLADRFRGDWDSQYRPMLQQLEQALADAAQDVHTSRMRLATADGQS